jgi:hypothetical protein
MRIPSVARLVVAIAVGAGVATASPVGLADPIAVTTQDAKAEFDKRYAAIDQKDAKALFDLAVWADEHELKTDSKRLLRKVIGIDPDHAKAREMLGYEKYDGKWMTKHDIETAKAKAEEAAKAKLGLKKWKGEWVPAADYDRLEKGLVKVEVGSETKWVTPVEKERIDKGMTLYEGVWATKEEVEHLKKGEFKVGDKWLTQAEADQAHADYNNAWELEGEFCKVTTTCPYAFGKQALKQGDATVKRTYQIVGLEMPKEVPKISLVIVKDRNDYNTLGRNARDNDDANLSSNWSTFVYADETTGQAVGVSVYEILDASNAQGNDNYSLGHVRFAAAAASLRNMKFTEKPPSWFTIGVAGYCERFWAPFVNERDVKKLAQWSLGRLSQDGPFVELGTMFDKFEINLRQILQAGFVVSYLATAQHAPKIDEQWKKCLDAFKAEKQKGLEKAFIKFEAQFAKDAKELDAYAATFGS